MSGQQQDRRPCFIGVGSNLNNPQAQIVRAFELVDAIPETTVISRSSLYRSAPFGPVEQPDFINAVVETDTVLEVRALLGHLQDIERSQGREPGVRWGPRVLDLDLLVLADEEVDEPGLIVPHPGIAERNFVLLPLREIAPEFVIPGLGRVADIAVNESEPRITRID